MKTKQKQAIIHLASGKSVVDTAKEVGCTRSSIFNWLKQPEFQSELQTAKTEWLEECRSQLRVIAKDALDALSYAVKPGSRPHGPQIKACELVLKACGIVTDFKPEIDNHTEIEMVFPGPTKPPEST